MSTISPLQAARLKYEPKLPPVLAKNKAAVTLVEGARLPAAADQDAIAKLFPNLNNLPAVTFAPGRNKSFDALTVGVILSGGQAPGGHNVIAGLFDGLKSLDPGSRLIGFLGGPKGVLVNKKLELTADLIDQYRNTGGFDIIGSGRDKIETAEHFAAARKTCEDNHIDALVIIGGDDSNTNACVLAEYFQAKGVKTRVIGCPKTIDGDLKNEYIEASFGFDTACKVYSEMIGNIERDALSAKKYWHFVKLMGRSASHIALECALRTQPNVCIVSEEVAARKTTLAAIVEQIAKVVIARSQKGLNFGVALIPEGLVEFIPEIKVLIGELNDMLGKLSKDDEKAAKARAKKLAGARSAAALQELGLSAPSAAVYFSLPGAIRAQLVMDRDPHGNVQVSRIETEKLLAELVAMRIDAHNQALEKEQKKLPEKERQKGVKFSGLTHFFGYEGRCAFPSNFDADYCYTLGYIAAALIGGGKTGYLAAVGQLSKGVANWRPAGIPITSMMNLERRHGENKPVIKKALVELDGKPFAAFAAKREQWAVENAYLNPGPIQYFGPAEVSDLPPISLQLEHA